MLEGDSFPRAAEDGLSEKMTLMTDEEAVVLKPRERHPRPGNSMCKGPEVRMSVTCRRSSKEAGVAGAERGRGGGREEGAGQVVPGVMCLGEDCGTVGFTLSEVGALEGRGQGKNRIP